MDEVRTGFYLIFNDPFGREKARKIDTPDVTMAVSLCKEILRDVPRPPGYSELMYVNPDMTRRRLASFVR